MFEMLSRYHSLVPELREAERLFNYATTAQDIDNAIMLMKIAEKKIIYLKSTVKNASNIQPIDEEPKTLLKHIREYIERRKKNG